MAASHPYHRFQLPSNAPFELQPSPVKGWGVFATRRIDKGFLILSEEPYCVIRKSADEITDEDIVLAFPPLNPS
ncbi:hypothetical protein N7467_005868 [Penicillium canescens]|nr:hypothetical protein N7467_005868 [Penicillium canescens]